MNYTPVTGVWEVTMGCNMRCKHCGSGCAQPLPDELNTAEALDLCDQIADLGLRWITLSGGEPFIRKDWPQLVKRLRDRGVVPNIISNGWLCREKVLQQAKEAGVGTIAISLDGLEENHDFMRKKGSYSRVVRALGMMRDLGITSGVITTISRRNLPELDGLKETLIGLGVRYWQIQIGLPMGNFAHNPEMIIAPKEVDAVIDFAYQHVEDDRISIYPADCVGYYSQRELVVRQKAHRTTTPPAWQGCNAGKRSLGILHNGDILGCTSIRDRRFIEGNVRERRLREIWESKNAFLWNRALRKNDLKGHCKTCQYGDLCLGGCPNTRLTMNGALHSENQYCSYNVALRQAEERLCGEQDVAELIAMARNFAAKSELQLASLTLDRALALEPDNADLLRLSGYVNFTLGNLEECRDANERILAHVPDDAYANKGMGLAMHRLGQTDRGIEYLRKAVDCAGVHDLDPYYDLAVVYLEAGRRDEARTVLETAKQLSPRFVGENLALYQAVTAG
ncbi:MAG: radical SAM protein [Candidatus Competibacteraceae bacterium]